MNKKAFTLMELLLVVAIIALFATSSIPFLMSGFGGFAQITTQEQIVNKLQEVSTVITRRVIFDNEYATAENINTIIGSLSNNDIAVSLKSVEDVKDQSNNIINDMVKITIKGIKDQDKHELCFIVYPAVK